MHSKQNREAFQLIKPLVRSMAWSCHFVQLATIFRSEYTSVTDICHPHPSAQPPSSSLSRPLPTWPSICDSRSVLMSQGKSVYWKRDTIIIITTVISITTIFMRLYNIIWKNKFDDIDGSKLEDAFKKKRKKFFLTTNSRVVFKKIYFKKL